MAKDAWVPTGRELETDTKHLFENCAWLYAFCREHLFRDHTEEITKALFLDGDTSQSMSVLEVGCGPGFYARRLARRYPALRVLGIDRSSRLLAWAQSRASSDGLANCRFQQGDVECISACVEAVDAVISSRLLLIVDNRSTVMAEIFQVLKPGGRLFLIEPTANLKTQFPLAAMRLAMRFIHSSGRETFPKKAKILSSQEFEDLVRSQPWAKVSIQMHGDYQCAVCDKSGDGVDDCREIERHVHDITVAGSRSVA
jgi:ubiquinone/menaquinone biosynthesis C-methylase UbiE